MADAPSAIDFDSPIAYYIQLQRILQHHIELGTYPSGGKLPSEPTLCRTFNISRTVVRQALQELERDGLIYKRKGKGTFVAEAKITESLVQKLTGFYTDMVEQGYEPTTKILLQTVLPASSKIASRLQIKPGTDVIVIERVRSVKKTPIVHVVTYLIYDKCKQAAAADLTTRSLYELLEVDCGLKITRGRRSIGANLATGKIAEHLHVPPRTPLILLESVSYLADGSPIEFYRAYHRGDKSKFRVELVRSRQHTSDAETSLDTEDFPNITPGNQLNS